MDYSKKYEQLLDGAHFVWPDTFSSPQQFIDTGDHNSLEYEKVAAKGADHEQRILDFFFTKVVEELQPEALKRYGSIQESSLRKLMLDNFNNPDDLQSGTDIMQLAKEAVIDGGLYSQDEQDDIYKLLELLPEIVLEFLIDGLRPWYLIPRSDAPQISRVLSDMFQEVQHANA